MARKDERRRFSRRRSNANSISARGFFQQSLLHFFLTLDAVPRPRHGFQALGVDFFAAVDTFAEAAFADPCQGSIHHLQQLPLVVALAEQKFLGIGTGSAVGDVLRSVFIRGTSIRLRASSPCGAVPAACVSNRFLNASSFFLSIGHVVETQEYSIKLLGRPIPGGVRGHKAKRR